MDPAEVAERAELQDLRDRAELKSLLAAKRSAPNQSGPTPIGPSVGESAMRGAAKGATLGFADKMYGALSAVVNPANVAPEKGFFEGLGERYDAGQAYAHGKDAAAKEANPWTYGGAELLGNIGTGSAAGIVGKAMKGAEYFDGAGKALSKVAAVMNAPKGTSTAGVLGRQIGLGGVTGAGDSTAHPFQSPDELARFGMDVGGGMATGGILAGGSKLLGSVLGKLAPEELKKFARERLVKAATGQNQRAIRKMGATGAADASGNALDAAGRIIGETDEAGAPIVGWFSNAEDILPKARAKQAYYGKEVGNVAGAIDEAIPNSVDAKKISQQMLDYAASLPENENTKPVIERILKDAERMEGKGQISFAEAQKQKGSYKFDPIDTATHTFGKEGSNKLNSIFREEMNQTANQVGGMADEGSDLKRLASQYLDLKTKYQAYRNIGDAGEKRVAANVSNRFASPSDYLSTMAAAMGSMAHGGGAAKTALVAAGAGVANKIARTRGSAFAGNAANAMASGLEHVPESVGTAAGAATQFLNSGMGAQAATNVAMDEFNTPDASSEKMRRDRLRQVMMKRLGQIREQGAFQRHHQQVQP